MIAVRRLGAGKFREDDGRLFVKTLFPLFLYDCFSEGFPKFKTFAEMFSKAYNLVLTSVPGPYEFKLHDPFHFNLGALECERSLYLLLDHDYPLRTPLTVFKTGSDAGKIFMANCDVYQRTCSKSFDHHISENRTDVKIHGNDREDDCTINEFIKMGYSFEFRKLNSLKNGELITCNELNYIGCVFHFCGEVHQPIIDFDLPSKLWDFYHGMDTVTKLFLLHMLRREFFHIGQKLQALVIECLCRQLSCCYLFTRPCDYAPLSEFVEEYQYKEFGCIIPQLHDDLVLIKSDVEYRLTSESTGVLAGNELSTD